MDVRKVAILQANLGNFDDCVDPVPQEKPAGVEKIKFQRFTDENFPPIAGLTPRLQYRIPKLFGWEMAPGYDVYIWLDGGITFQRADSVGWYLEQLGDKDAVFFRHPWRQTMKQETDHIEEKLKQKHRYILPRYGNGLHKEMYAEAIKDPEFVDDKLFCSTVFVYRNTPKVQEFMKQWWYYQSRYYTCDQLAQTYALSKSKLNITEINEVLYRLGHVCLVSHHKRLE